MASGTNGSSGRRGAAGRARASSAKAGAAVPLDAPRWSGGNRILAALSPTELAVLRPNLVPATLASGHVAYKQGARMDAVYFPETAVASLVSRMSNGAVVEVGTIGNEGVVGLGLALGACISVSEVLIQIPGTVQQMAAVAFTDALEELPHFRALVARSTHAFMTQVSQTAACNRLHRIEQRCARWLLLTHDRVGGIDTFPLTHQFLAFMLGVRRAGVTEALGALTVAGLIASTQGRVTILDRDGLEAACCECYAVVRLNVDESFDGARGV
jgi:CRP-like cAMP-binding protein